MNYTVCRSDRELSKNQHAQSAGAVEYTDFTYAEGQDPSNNCPGYDIKQPEGEVPVMLKFWGMRSIPSLSSLPGRL